MLRTASTPESARDAARFLKERRIEFEPVRQKLRCLAGQLKETELPPPSNDFVLAFMRYLPDGQLVSDDTGSPSAMVHGVLEEYGGHRLIIEDENDIADDAFGKLLGTVVFARKGTSCVLVG